MKVGDLVIWKHRIGSTLYRQGKTATMIGVVIGADYGYVTVHWFEDGYVSRENSRDLREVTNESR